MNFRRHLPSANSLREALNNSRLNKGELSIRKRVKHLPKASLYEIALVFFGSRHKYVCEGASMNPTLEDGETVLVDRAAKIEVGDIVIARHPVEQSSEVVKRIERINERGHYFLVGDNLDNSNDSRHFGAVAKEYIKGKVVARLR